MKFWPLPITPHGNSSPVALLWRTLCCFLLTLSFPELFPFWGDIKLNFTFVPFYDWLQFARNGYWIFHGSHRTQESLDRFYTQNMKIPLSLNLSFQEFLSICRKATIGKNNYNNNIMLRLALKVFALLFFFFNCDKYPDGSNLSEEWVYYISHFRALVKSQKKLETHCICSWEVRSDECLCLQNGRLTIWFHDWHLLDSSWYPDCHDQRTFSQGAILTTLMPISTNFNT